MGCASSNLSIKDFNQEILLKNGGDYVNHIVSLTSSTYGALKLHNDQQQYMKVSTTIKTEIYKKLPPCKEPDFVNSWELMQGLEDENTITFRSPLKFLNQKDFPIKTNSNSGFVDDKENRGVEYAFCSKLRKTEQSLTNTLNEKNLCDDDESWMISPKVNWICPKLMDDDFVVSPMFDPMLIASYEKELYEGEEEQIKMIVSSQTISPKQIKSRENDVFFKLFEKKCPPGGENSVVIYTTTLGGIRKTFEDCNNVRSIIESHQIQMFERDLSMDSGFREELRELIGKNIKDVKIPIVFVKGRLIGGVNEVRKLDEEGKLRVLFDGIPRGFGCCEMCGNVRFVMCMDCHGSCKIFDEETQMNVNCGECNENGLIQCPVCS